MTNSYGQALANALTFFISTFECLNISLTNASIQMTPICFGFTSGPFGKITIISTNLLIFTAQSPTGPSENSAFIHA